MNIVLGDAVEEADKLNNIGMVVRISCIVVFYVDFNLLDYVFFSMGSIFRLSVETA
jgi:hypothetical protein